MRFKSWLLIQKLSCCSAVFTGSRRTVYVTVQRGDDLLLELDKSHQIRWFWLDRTIVWKFNDSDTLLKFSSHDDPRVDLSVKLKNLQMSDSGVYTAQVPITDYYIQTIAEYTVTVEGGFVNTTDTDRKNLFLKHNLVTSSLWLNDVVLFIVPTESPHHFRETTSPAGDSKWTNYYEDYGDYDDYGYEEYYDTLSPGKETTVSDLYRGRVLGHGQGVCGKCRCKTEESDSRMYTVEE